VKFRCLAEPSNLLADVFIPIDFERTVSRRRACGLVLTVPALGGLRAENKSMCTFDLFQILADGAIDFGDFRQLLTSDCPVRAGVGADLRAIHREIDASQQPHVHTLLNDALEEFKKERRLLKTAVSIVGECRVMRNLLIEAKPSEPAIGQVHSCILDQTALASDAVQVSDQQNAQWDFGIDRRATCMGCSSLSRPRERKRSQCADRRAARDDLRECGLRFGSSRIATPNECVDLSWSARLRRI